MTNAESLPTMSGSGSTASSAAHDKEALKAKASAVKSAVGDLASEARQFAAAKAHDAKDTAVAWAHTGKEKAVKAGETTVDYIQRNPYQALAIAAGIGFVAGLILKRR